MSRPASVGQSGCSLRSSDADCSASRIYRNSRDNDRDRPGEMAMSGVVDHIAAKKRRSVAFRKTSSFLVC